MQEVDNLRTIGPRQAGSESERRAARHLEKRLEELGRDAELEPMRIRPAYALTHAIHAVAGVIASVLAVYKPGIGFTLAALTSVSAFGDLSGVFYLLRSLTPVRASQNVVSDEDTGKPGVIVLAAHYDNPRGGMLAGPRLAPLWPRALFWSLAVITACCAARVVSLDATWLTVIQFIPTVVLIVLTPLFVDAAIAQPGPDAPTSDESVATVLSLATTSLEHFDLVLLFTGASAGSGIGMRNWLGRHGGELEPETTAVISVDASPKDFADREGTLVPARMHSTLVELAAESGGDSYTSRELSDAFRARAASLPAIRMSPSSDIGALLQRIDEEIGPRLV